MGVVRTKEKAQFQEALSLDRMQISVLRKTYIISALIISNVYSFTH